MKEWLPIFAAVMAVFAVAGLGFMLRRLNWLTPQADKSIMDLIIRVFSPCLILFSVISNTRLRQWDNLIWPPLVGFGTLVMGFIVAALVARLLRARSGLQDPSQRRTFAMSVGLYNYGFVPIPLVLLLFSPETLGVLFVHNLGVEFGLWTAGVLLLAGGLKGAWWKHLITPPSVAVVAGVLLNQARLEQHLTPALMKGLLDMLQMLGNCTIPMSVLLVGATICDHLRDADWPGSSWSTVVGCVLRMAVLPLIFVLLAWLLPISIDLKRIIVIQSAMPSAMFTLVMAKYYHGDTPTALRIMLATSALSLLTIPFWLSVGLWMIG